MAAKVFYLVRLEDATGVSGVGIVAEGCQFSKGDAIVRWLGEHPSLVWWPRGWKDAEVIHSHGGKTKIVWADDGPPKDAGPGFDINAEIKTVQSSEIKTNGDVMTSAKED